MCIFVLDDSAENIHFCIYAAVLAKHSKLQKFTKINSKGGMRTSKKCPECGGEMLDEKLEWKCSKCGYSSCIEPEYCPS
jgi:ribosomal protein S27AE